ncbi:MAG TPA: UDP-galactopyranose mutase [Candidatus Kapabacteria bacterium]|nr:UDP-galactopyranose mutase [Candidatus Kapabacteria bacterium]
MINSMKFDYVIVGAGFAGSTLAERLANGLNKKVLVIEKRDHMGGNSFDCYNEDGILVKPYGPHIFHTKIKEVWDYLNRFTSFNHYVHRVIANVNGKEYYFPINLDTMEQLTGWVFTPETLREYFAAKRLEGIEIKNSRDVVVSQVGEEIYELFVKHYTKKQWGVYPGELGAEVLQRIPVRYDRDTRYFDDPWQGIPVDGYHKLFENMLKHKNIQLLLRTDYKEIIDEVEFDRLIYTGPVDYYFDYVYGKLPYRSIRFTFETYNIERFQGAAVVNYTLDKEYTRITEFKHFYFQRHPATTICYEYPCDEGDPYYPIPREDNRRIYEKYRAAADKLKNTHFVGRLAEYKYLNIDQAVKHALDLFVQLS